MSIIRPSDNDDIGKLKLLDQRQVLSVSQGEEHESIEAKVILASAVSQCQGSGQDEAECNFVRLLSLEPDTKSVLEDIQCFSLLLNESTRTDEEVKKLRDRLKIEQEPIKNGHMEDVSSISFRSHMLLLSDTLRDHSDPQIDLLVQLLEHFQLILSFTPTKSVTYLKLWSLTARQDPVDASLTNLSIVLQSLQSLHHPSLVRDLIVATADGVEDRNQTHARRYKLKQRLVHDIFVETASAYDSRPAIDAWDGQLTYKELDDLSTSLAILWKDKGVGSEVVVPLLFEKTKWTVISMLSILKAGGAFLFLDPAHPHSRIQSIIDRVGANFSLTSSSLLDRLGPLRRSLIAVDEISGLSEGPNVSHFKASVSPQNTAFLIFTSGSTGEPKGVVTEHQALSSGIIEQAHGLGIDNQSRVLQSSMPSFAAAIVEMLFTVVVGGCVCIPTLAERFDNLPGAFNRMKATFGIFPPSYTATTDPKKFKTLRVAVIGSESLSKAAVSDWLEVFDVRHGYGTSEINTINAAASLDRKAPNLRSIGQGFAHHFWVVDALNHNRLLMPGFAGELLIESPATARGYLNNEAATDKAFIQAPTWYLNMYGTVPDGTKFYKTGDFGRTNKNGDIEILGRTDPLQVKLRGQRIELGEVEACSLNALPPSTTVFAELVMPVSQPRPHLALFCIVSAIHLTDIEIQKDDDFVPPGSVSDNLRRHMRATREILDESWRELLPPFMRPNYLIPLRRVPRTATGKIGRRLMREWASQYDVQELRNFTEATTTQRTVTALEGETEDRLARVWSQVFDVSVPTIHSESDFFEFGGDSLTAMKLVQAARDHGLKLQVTDIIKLHNFRDVARTSSKLDAMTEPRDMPHHFTSDRVPSTSFAARKLNVSPDEIERVLPTTDSQSRAIRLGAGPEKCLVYHFVVSAGTGKELDASRLVETLQKLVQRHDSLRTALFKSDDDVVFQAILKRAKIVVETVIGDNADDKLLTDRITASDIEFDSVPTKFWTIKHNHSNRIDKFVMRVSHAQFDGVSLPVMWRSLSRLYSDSALDPISSFSQYIQSVFSTDRDAAVAYFTNLLKDVPFTDVLRHRIPGHHPQDRLFRKSYVLPSLPFTPSILFEAAWAYVLYEQTKDTVVTFDHIVSGRQLPTPGLRTMEVVGTCLNDVPVCVRLEQEMSVNDLLTQIQAQHVASAQHETLGFKTILEVCKPTQWPKDARMTSSVQFRGFEHVTEVELGEVACKIEMVERSMDLEDLTILVEPARRDVAREYDVIFASSSTTCPEARAQNIFKLFSETVERFCLKVDSQVFAK